MRIVLIFLKVKTLEPFMDTSQCKKGRQAFPFFGYTMMKTDQKTNEK